MNQIQFKYEIKDCVAHIGSGHTNHDRHIGYIVSRELFEDTGGTKIFYNIRWIDPAGRSSDGITQLSEWELNKVEDK